MTVLEITKKFLESSGYDGLFSDFSECACLVDDLAPCVGDIRDCEPGYRAKCDCGEGCLFHITDAAQQAVAADGATPCPRCGSSITIITCPKCGTFETPRN